MPYTLKQLIDENVIENIHLITPHLNLEKYAVHAASVQELPIKGFLHAQDVVLSSAMGSEKDPAIIDQVIEESSASKASAIMFAFDYDQKLSKEQIRKAEDLGLPLFMLSYDLGFTDVQNRINEAVQNWRLDIYRKLQDRLFDAYFHSRSVDSMVQIIADILGQPTALYNVQDVCLAKTEDFQEGNWNILVGALEQPFGFLTMQGDAPDKNLREQVRQYIAYPLSLWFNQRRVEEITTLQLRSDFALQLARGDYEDYEEMVRQSKILDVNLDLHYSAVVLTLHAGNQQMERRILEMSFDILGMGRQEARREHRAAIVGGTGNQFIFFLENAYGSISQGAESFVTAMESKIETMLPHTWCLWGISGSLESEGDFVQSYNEAMLALHYCDSSLATNQRQYFQQARSLRIMSAVSAERAIRHDAEALLSGILDYDAANGSMELMKTLTTFIQCNYNTSKAARDLNIHRQSLLARLSKIEELTGFSLKNHEDLFVLETYSRIYTPYTQSES